MGLIGTHQLTTFSSPVNGASPIDGNTVRGNDNSIKTAYNAHDADATIHAQNGLIASRPAASTAGQTWLSSDTGAVYQYLDTGSAWVEVNYLRNTGGTMTGVLALNTVVTTGATAGDLVLPNLHFVRGVNAAGTNTIALVLLDANNTVRLGDGSSVAGIGFPVSVTSATAGDVVMQNAKGLRAANAAGTDTLALIGLSAANKVSIDAGATGVLFGGTVGGITTLTATTLGGALSTAAQPAITSVGTLSGLTVTAAIVGSVTGASGSTTGNAATATALQTARAINGVSFDGSAPITVTAAAGTLSGASLNATVTGSSLTSVGALTGLRVNGITTLNHGVVTSAAAGDLVLPNLRFLRSVNAAATDTVALVFADANNTVRMGDGTTVTGIGFPVSVSGATAGDLVMQNAKGLRGSNAAGTTSIATIGISASDKVSIDAGAVGAVFGGTVSGISTLTATTLTGTLSSAAQTAITSVGTLTSLAVTNAAVVGTVRSASGSVSVPNATATTVITLSGGGYTYLVTATGPSPGGGTSIGFVVYNVPLSQFSLQGSIGGTQMTVTPAGAVQITQSSGGAITYTATFLRLD